MVTSLIRRASLATVGLLLACGGGGGRRTYIDPPVRGEVVVTPGQATLTWEKSSEQHSTLIARTLGTVEATPPDGGVVGDQLGAGVIIAITEGERFVDNNLPDTCGPFAWHVWSRHADGTWASEALTLRSLRGAHTLAPAAEVTNVAAAIEAGKLRIEWTPPEVGTNFKGVNVLRKVGSPPDGVNDGVLVYAGPSSAALEQLSNLSTSQATHYAVFNCNDCGKCGANAPSIAVSPVVDGGVTLDISNLTAAVSADGVNVELSWVANAPRVKVLRKQNQAPASINDAAAELIFDGAGSTATDAVTKLLPNDALNPTHYVYRAWACIDTLCSQLGTQTEFRLTLKQALKAGGYTLFFRHGTGDSCSDDLTQGKASNPTTPNWWKSCDATCGAVKVQQLDGSASTSELNGVRAFFQSSGVAVSRVLSSEFCRALTTAQGFGLTPTIEQTPALTYFVYDEADRCQDTISLLGAAPAVGTNTVHVGHTQYATPCLNLDGLVGGEAAVFRPQLGAPPRFVTRVPATGWASLP